MVALVVAVVAMARQSPCDNPGSEPLAAVLVALVGSSALLMLGALAVARWVDVTAAAAVVAVLLALAWAGWDRSGGAGSLRRSSRVGVR